MPEDIKRYLPPPYLYKKEKRKIDTGNPWERDLLDREKVASELNLILERVTQPMVMTVTAPYGMGKTTFLECWQADIIKAGGSAVMFNAWETDFSKDPFIAFVTAIEDQLSEDKKVKEKFLSSAKRLGGAIFKSAPGFAAKVVAKAAIGEKGVEALENFELTEDDAVKLTESIANEAFKNQRKVEKTIESFRSNFEKIISDECDGRLMVFIDELDRCRPKYAVEVLESIKHVFSVPGVIFVLAIDEAQLISSFKGVYGPDLNAKGYFTKFVDWSFHLPDPDYLKYITHLSVNIFDFKQQGGFSQNDATRSSLSLFYNICMILTSSMDLSLRDLGRCFTYVNMALQKCKGQANTNEIAIAAFLKVANKEFYDDLRSLSNSSDILAQEEIQKVVKTVFLIDELLLRRMNRTANTLCFILLEFFSVMADYGEEPKLCLSEANIEEIFDGQTHLSVGLLRARLSDDYQGTDFNFHRGSKAVETCCL